MENVLIRQAVPADLEAITKFDHLAYLASRINFLKRILTSGCCYVAENENTIIGYGALEYSFYDFGFISILYVDLSLRQKGFGVQLMRYFEKICKTEKLFTSINRSNKPMQALLEKIGYQPSGMIENLDEKDPELVYFKRIRI